MLSLRRREGQWTTITHRTGEVLRILVYEIDLHRGEVVLSFDDPARDFDIQRPERKMPPAAHGQADQ